MTLPDLHLQPLLPFWSLALMIAAALALLWYGGRGGIAAAPRLLCVALLALALLNPRLQSDVGSTLEDIVLVVVDDSASMQLGDRAAQRDQALAEVQKRLAALPDLQIRVLHQGGGSQEEGTRLFGALAQGLADIPKSRLAGAILLTDGQVHDVPAQSRIGAPLHVLLAGSRKDRDRRLVIDSAPAFAMVGAEAELIYHVEDQGHDGVAEIALRRDGGPASKLSVQLNRRISLRFPIDHEGANVVELDVAGADGELTGLNNRSAVSISGVRDRLRVLLLSGEPHPGERMWRNLLKADPSVDLVHFTILRSPDKDDRTPIQQLSLIAFPTRELFEERLGDFDLIIFDRFRRRNILPPAYYRNIAEHVRSGGALLMVAGPELAAPDSPAGSALAAILPGRSDGTVLDRPFLPMLTEIGRRHPLFDGLPEADAPLPHWGRWVRAAGSVASPGSEVVMATKEGLPLLLLAHEGEGRVAQLNSDSVWLWGRGWDGGGPQAELLRRLAHWLMKEPELEENRLTGRVQGGKLRIERRSLDGGPAEVTVTRPDGSRATLTLTDHEGRAVGEIAADQNGMWRIESDAMTALVAVGSLNLLEMGDVRASAEKLQPAVSANGGGLFWLEDGLPGITKQSGDGHWAGSGWMGLRANGQRSLTASISRPLLPPWLLFGLIAAALAYCWRREGRR